MVDARSQYLASKAPRRRRTHPARSAKALNTSGAGIVHRQMMDLQRQPNLNKADTARLKDLRRDWNRNRKYTDAGMAIAGASSPLDAQMYPVSDLAMRYGESGGLLGMIAKDMLGKVSDFGKSMVNREGIAGAADADEAEMEDYAAQTFGMGAPIDRHPGSTPVIEGPMEQSEVIYSPHGPTYYDRAEGLDFDEDPNQPYVAPDDYVEDDFGAFYIDENTLAPERGLPFDDTNREQAIANQFATNFIGPRDDPYRRPDMYDVVGPRLIDRGLIPYPEYGPGIVYQEGRGRGDLPMFGFDYDDMRKRITDEYRMREALKFLDEKEEPQPSRMNLR